MFLKMLFFFIILYFIHTFSIVLNLVFFTRIFKYLIITKTSLSYISIKFDYSGLIYQNFYYLAITLIYLIIKLMFLLKKN